MPRNITITFNDGASHRYENIPDTVTPDMIEARCQKDFPGKKITNIDGGRKASAELNQVKKNAGISPETYKNADWEISCKIDKLTDKKECVIWMRTNHNVQCNPEPGGGGTLYVGTPRRQTPSFIYTRFDNDPPTNNIPNHTEKAVHSAMYPLQKISGRSKLRVRIISILQDTYDFDINLSTLQDAIQQYLQIR